VLAEMGQHRVHQHFNMERFPYDPDTLRELIGYLQAIRPSSHEDEWNVKSFRVPLQVVEDRKSIHVGHTNV